MSNPKKRILVVDDEPPVTRGIRRILEDTGEFEVREENRSTHALIAAREFLPNLILLDVKMGVVDGGELASKFRENSKFRDVPIVFLTALVTREEAIKSHPGGERFLAKPVKVEDLIACLHEELIKHAPHPVETKPPEDSTPHFAY